jgi:hypothetical protein
VLGAMFEEASVSGPSEQVATRPKTGRKPG